MALAVDLILRNPALKVLAFYPARALIQDQMEKWEDILGPLGITSGYIDGGVAMGKRLSILDSVGTGILKALILRQIFA
jgi:ATP-dependent helicase YprA (DUF1998 family)